MIWILARAAFLHADNGVLPMINDFVAIACAVGGAILCWCVTAENLFYKRRDRHND